MKPQDFSNHVKWDPQWHYVLIPLLLLNVFYRIFEMLDTEISLGAIWDIVTAGALLLMGLMARWKALKVQDRLIRLEERLRMAELLPPTLLAKTGDLTVPQILALRFASDAELPGLVEETLKTQMGNQQIKQAIKNWRADHFRV
jgi:hypothetical protein